MKMTLHEIDEQIREVENRIAVERIALGDAVHSCTNSLREAITSPKTLLTLLGVGYAVGKMMFKEKRPESQKSETAKAKKAGVLGLVTGFAGTAISLANSRWAGMARWAAGRYFARRRAARAAADAAASPTGVRPARPATPSYTRTPPPGAGYTPAAGGAPSSITSSPPSARAL
jgi:hypothetical protein